MKKFLSILLTIFLLASFSTLAVSANDGLMAVTSALTNMPDWVITEICQDQSGYGVGGWSSGNDCMEFIEIYNSSGKTLNLYDYCITYNGNVRTHANFETVITEITPIKAGDYLDGTTLPWTDQANACGDLSNKPVNPATCSVAPGEVVVLWFMYRDVYFASWNDGKGLSIANFREQWDIPEGVKIICVDGNGDTAYGGHDKNFNIKNSETGTYGIALYSDDLNSTANNNSTYPTAYTDFSDLAAWATMDFPNQLGTTMANLTANFTIDIQGYGAEEWGYVADGRRMLLLEKYCEATAGTLTTLQKLTLGVALDAGEGFIVPDMIYAPNVSLGDFQGLAIDGVLYPINYTFTATTAGVYNLQFKYANDSIVVTDPPETEPVTEPPVTEPPVTEPPATEPPATGTGDTDNTTEAPGSSDVTTAAPEDEDKKCGSSVGFGVLACLIPAGIILGKKKRK